MKRELALLIFFALAIASSGCSTCCGPFDYHYPTFGGKHERVDPVHGRVGSILSDPLAPRAALASADSNLVPHPPLSDRDNVDQQRLENADDKLDGIREDLEDITPLEDDNLPDPDELDARPTRGNVNKKTRLQRRRPIR